MLPRNPTAANVLGIAGAICWSIQLIPQIIINYRRHNATGLQPTMMLLWACAGVPLGVYNISKGFNIALRVQPQVLSLLSLVTWSQCVYYEKKYPRKKAIAICAAIATVLAGIQVGGIFGLRHTDKEWPQILTAVIAASCLGLGVLRHYWDIYTFRTVRGISFIFVSLDAMGDLTSLLSIFFQPNFDVLGVAVYTTELVLWIGIMICGVCFNLREWWGGRRNRSQEREDGISLEQQQQQQRQETSEVVNDRASSSSVSVFRTSGSFHGSVHSLQVR